jgi:ribosomal-protein-alanine N-acetyltransferase
MPEFDFTSFPTLTTPRLILRQSIPSDAEDLFAYLSDPEVLTYEVFGPLKEVSDAVFAIEANQQRFLSKEGITWNIVLKRENRGIGGIGLRPQGVRRECVQNPDGSFQNWGLFGML